jgi:spermidine/putrescine transport system substrate-binding protein
MSRRQFLQRASTYSLAAGSLLAGCSSSTSSDRVAKNQVNIFSWADYLPPHGIEEFEKRYGIRVVFDTFASNESLLARMEAGSSDYDIIVPSSYIVPKLNALHLLRPIDKERIPNSKYLMTRFTQMSFDPGGKYAIPYAFGTTGIGYNRAAFKAAGATEPRDWDVFWDQRFKGRMTLLEDSRETLGFALKRRGHTCNTVDPVAIEQAKNDLIVQKPLTMCYTSDQVIVSLAGGDAQLSLVFSGDAHQAGHWNSDVRYTIPESGASTWIDSLCIPAGAPHVENAHKWINFLLEPQISAALTDYTFYATPNHGALKYISKANLNDPTLYPSEAVLDKCDEIKDIGNGLFLFDKAWTELKCV